MNTEAENTAALPLDELELTPEWVKSPARTFEKHPGDKHDHRPRDREQRRDGPRPGGPRPPHRREGGPSAPRAGPRRETRPEVVAVAPVEVTFLPEEQGFASMIETIKQSPRAYALFDLAKLILNKPERHRVKVVRQAQADGTRPPLYFIAQTEAPCLTKEEAIRQLFRRHLALVAKIEKKQIDPPKGNFAFVNRCGITGEWLGPPNYHEYQARLVRHHQHRLRHVPFEDFRAKIQTVRDEAAVKSWLEALSVKTEFVCTLAAEPKTFASREELEKYVVENHLDQFITPIHELVIGGTASRTIEHPGIMAAVRHAWESERRFPLKTVNELRPRLQKESFYFFKHPNGVTYVSHIRLKRFEAGATISDQVQLILNVLRATKKGVTAKELLKQLGVGAPAPAETAPPSPSLEERLLADLRWLIADGYVVELSDGRLWSAPEKQPAPPPPPAPEPTAAVAPPENPVPAEPPVASPPAG